MLPALPRELPPGRQRKFLDAGVQHIVGADVDGDHIADTLFAHHVDGQVVDHCAVHVHLIAMEHRRQHARNRA